MRRTYSIVSLVILVVAFGWSTLDADPPRDDEADVRAVVQKYFDGMMNGSPETLAEAFDPEAFLIGPGRGTPTRLPFEGWSSGMTHAFGTPETHVNTITMVDVAGDAAVAKTRLAWPNVIYVDYLSLLKIDGEWRIVNKIWHQEPTPAALSRIDEVPISDADLARYAGTYRAGENDLSVWVDHGRLGMARPGGVPNQLLHVGDGSFAIALNPEVTIAFAADGERVTGFELHSGENVVAAERLE